VYDKSTGTLTDYSDMGEVNNLLMAAEEKIKDPSSNIQRPLAKRMLVIIVRGLFTSMKFLMPSSQLLVPRVHNYFHYCINVSFI